MILSTRLEPSHNESFLSYSLNDNDQFILTLLASELTSRVFSITQSSDFNTEISQMVLILGGALISLLNKGEEKIS